MSGEMEFGYATAAVKDSSETGSIVEGLTLTRAGVSDTPVLGLGERQPVKLAGVGTAFYGVAQAAPDEDDGLAARHFGIVPVKWDGVGTLVKDDPIKTAADGEVTKWLTGTDTAELLIGFCEVIPDSNDDAYMRLGIR